MGTWSVHTLFSWDELLTAPLHSSSPYYLRF